MRGVRTMARMQRYDDEQDEVAQEFDLLRAHRVLGGGVLVQDAPLQILHKELFEERRFAALGLRDSRSEIEDGSLNLLVFGI